MRWDTLKRQVFTVPNFITLFRFWVVFLLFWVWFTKDVFDNEIIRIIVVIFLFILGSLSDYFDGYWARYYKVKSKVGAFMDSLVDKFFTLSFFVAYVYIDLIEVSWILVMIIFIREITITWLRIDASLRNLVMVTEKHGKLKMVLQIVYQSIMWVYFLLYAVTYESSGFQTSLLEGSYAGKPLLKIPFSIYENFYLESWGVPQGVVDFFWLLPNILLSGVAGFTLYSGISYVLKARHHRQA